MPFILVLPAAFIAYFLSGIAETGRAPFDLLEADSEIVAGYFVEYSGLKFGWFYIAEYGNLFAISAIDSHVVPRRLARTVSRQSPALGPFYFIVKTVAGRFPAHVDSRHVASFPYRSDAGPGLEGAGARFVGQPALGRADVSSYLCLFSCSGRSILAGSLGVLFSTLGILGRAARRHTVARGVAQT